MYTTLPNALTLSRIVAIPLLVAAFWLPHPADNWAAAGIFAAASVTDYFDGYFARRWGQISRLGRFLDPIADKLLVAAALMLLVAFHGIEGLTILPAILVMCREILVSGLREFLAQINVGMPVSALAKWKTGIQMVAIGILLVGDAGPAAIPVQLIGEIGLWIAAALTLITGYDYLRAGLEHMAEPPPLAKGVQKAPDPTLRRVP